MVKQYNILYYIGVISVSIKYSLRDLFCDYNNYA